MEITVEGHLLCYLHIAQLLSYLVSCSATHTADQLYTHTAAQLLSQLLSYSHSCSATWSAAQLLGQLLSYSVSCSATQPATRPATWSATRTAVFSIQSTPTYYMLLNSPTYLKSVLPIVEMAGGIAALASYVISL